MDLEWNDLVIDKAVIDEYGSRLIQDLLWLIPKNVYPMLGTACGDLFLEQVDDGSIAFLDTVVGQFSTVAANYKEWKASLESRNQMEAWFRFEFIAELL